MRMIEFNHVSKRYQLGAYRTSLREALTEAGRKFIRFNHRNSDKEIFWALKDVSFQVEEGEVLGIIGHNGAGKSTTLKLLSKVTFPTSGHIQTQGRMAALIELGAGFHPDLTGRENVYLNGSILGLKRCEIESSFEEIVEFAELGKFIDTPVKRYSSGMYVRLAFSVAAHVKADLLLVDEVLSVGDMSFQLKCLNKMNELRDSGTTIVFISHNLYSISSFCKRALLLQNGQIINEGPPPEVVQFYRDNERKRTLHAFNQESFKDSPVITNPIPVVLDQIELLNNAGEAKCEFSPEEEITIRCKYHTKQEIFDPRYVIQIRRADGFLCTSFSSEGYYGATTSKTNQFEVRIGPLYLQPDYYTFNFFIANNKTGIMFAKLGEDMFQITGNMRNGEGGIIIPNKKWY